MGTLIEPRQLAELASAGAELVVVDCRFSLADKARGRASYEEGHIPGAFYLDLERDLSGPVVPGVTGRHPLPGLDGFAQRLAGFGLTASARLVAYDDASGAFAARLWWLSKLIGHEHVEVLDGGLARWTAEGFPLDHVVPEARPGELSVLSLHAESIAAVDEVEAMRERPDARLFDAREGDRYRGENETIDPVAGHIPGAVSLPYSGNSSGGRFKTREELRARYADALGGTPSSEAIVYCGSGVTACQAVLAAEHAGFPGLRLYPGSFSEWITDPSRPVRTGP